MTYDTIATISQVTSLLLFIGMFAAVLTYALWPKNAVRFDSAQRRALDLEPEHDSSASRREGGTHEQAS